MSRLPTEYEAANYIVLARKYRPQSFDDLVGQDHVAQTLRNAIESDRVAHAFLFTGVRGVGKTTSARLLAKALNCLGADGRASKATPSPCQVCAACQEITRGTDLDVQEIDGASYNGVDEVRKLQEGLAYRPTRDRYKIYIVDEVHMLSTAAWNAFLKTLEEPPPHVKFIFATTEVNKVPVTILSRCQRYDFKMIRTQVIAETLGRILKAEEISADESAIVTIAREAAGSMRDALSLTDQVIAFSGAKVSREDVANVLGVADRKIIHELTASLLDAEPSVALNIVDRLAEQGFDMVHVARDVLGHLRNLVVAKVNGDEARQLIDLADDEVRDAFELVSKNALDDLLRLYSGFSRSYDDIARSGQPKMALEMTLVRLSRRPSLLPLDELISRIGDLEKRLGGGSGSVPTNPSSGPVERRGTSPRPTKADHAAEPVVAKPVVPEPVVAKPVVPEPVVSKPVISQPKETDPMLVWRAIIAQIRDNRPALASLYEHAVIQSITNDQLVISYDSDSVFLSEAQSASSLEALRASTQRYFGKPIDVQIRVQTSLRTREAPATVASIDAQNKRIFEANARKDVENNPLVQSTISLFSAELRDVQLNLGAE